MSDPLATERTTARSSSLLSVNFSLEKKTERRSGTCPYQRDLRSYHQQRIDRVDIPRPTEWLHHDAIAALQLSKSAQINLQLLTPAQRWQQPHSSSSNGAFGRPAMDPPSIQIVGQVKGVVSSTFKRGGPIYEGMMKCSEREKRTLRILCGSDVLPWGTWPVRLRNHEGENFYGEGDLDDGEAAGALHWTGGGGVGGSASRVDAAGAVSEHSIHDELLRQHAPLPPRFCSSSISSFSNPSRDAARDGCGGGNGGGNSSNEAGETELKRRHFDEGTVKRLLPDKRGRWVEAKAPTPSDPAATTLFVDDEHDGSPTGTAPPFLAAPPTHPQPGPNDTRALVKRLIAGRYGGWVEIEETAEEAAHKNLTKHKNRRNAIAAAASRAGPDFSAPVAQTERREDRKSGRRLRVAKSRCSVDTDGGDGQVGHGGETAEGRSSADVVGGKHGVGGGGGGTSGAPVAIETSNGRGCDAQQGIDACGYGNQGWTVSEPAKDTVRRVWNRARRRARDTCEPRHRSPAPPAAAPFTAAAAAASNPEAVKRRKGKRRKGRGIAQQLSDHDSDIGGETEGSDSEDDEFSRGDEEHVDGQGGASAPDGGIKDSMDPVLLSCLGKECEGIIDAALHVVLRQQLLRQSSESTSDPPVAADWEDVLRTMWGCSAAARAAAMAGRDDGGEGRGGQEGSGRGKRGRRSTGVDIDSQHTVGVGDADAPAAGQGREQEEKGWAREVWGVGDASDGATVVVNERLAALPLNEAVVTRAYNRLLLDLNEQKWWDCST